MSSFRVVAIFCDREFDQFMQVANMEDESILARECADLRQMGHKVHTRTFDSWLEAETWEDKRNGRR